MYNTVSNYSAVGIYMVTERHLTTEANSPVTSARICNLDVKYAPASFPPPNLQSDYHYQFYGNTGQTSHGFARRTELLFYWAVIIMQGDSNQLPCYAASTQHPPLQHISCGDTCTAEVTSSTMKSNYTQTTCTNVNTCFYRKKKTMCTLKTFTRLN